MKQHIPRILCIDDEPHNLSLLETMLIPRGYEVVTVVSGMEALEKIKTERIDICLLDVMMPVMDGFEVCRRIKADEAHHSIPVVMITSLSEKEFRIRGIEAGAEEFLTKPFDKAEVLARIKKLLQVKSLNEQLELSRARYFELYDLAPVGYLTLDKQWRIQEANLAAASILGVPRAGLQQNLLAKFIFPEDVDAFCLHIKADIETVGMQVWEMLRVT